MIAICKLVVDLIVLLVVFLQWLSFCILVLYLYLLLWQDHYQLSNLVLTRFRDMRLILREFFTVSLQWIYP